MEDPRVESLPCALTPDEVRQRGEEVARLLKERDDREYERAANAKAAKEEIAELEVRIACIAAQVRDRQEYRGVEVACLRDPDNALVVWVRRDTGEVVRQRPMTDEERQERLPFEDRVRRALDPDEHEDPEAQQ